MRKTLAWDHCLSLLGKLRDATRSSSGWIIRIHHECEVGIDKSVPRITNWNHEACQVMANGDAEVQQFSIPFSHN